MGRDPLLDRAAVLSTQDETAAPIFFIHGMLSLLCLKYTITLDSMKKDIVPLAMELMKIPSFAGESHALQNVIDMALEPLSDFTVEHFDRNETPSALVFVGAKRPPSFDLLLNAHLDVIPGRPDQYMPRLDGDRLYGVGSMDMKANAAVLIHAFRDIAPTLNVSVGLQLVCDEEVGGFDGTQYQVEEGVRADFVLAGEPTSFDIVHQAKGICWMTITANGTSAHGAYPWRGDNAISKIRQFLNYLDERFPNPKEDQWVTTVNVSIISTNNTVMNKVPDDCTVRLDIRYVPEDEGALVETVRSLLPEGCSLKVDVFEPALDTPKESPYLKMLADVVRQQEGVDVTFRGANGSSDARHFAPVGGQGIEFGPVGGNIGADDEWVSVSSLDTYYDIITSFMCRFDNETQR